MKRSYGLLVLVLTVGGCTTPANVTAGNQYRHPTTGDSKTCNDDARPSIWVEIFCSPCYYQAKANAYADCKNDLEAKGYVRQ